MYTNFDSSIVYMMVLIIFNNYYLCSLHGLIRGENMELGRDSDTGGQVIFCWRKSVQSNPNQIIVLLFLLNCTSYIVAYVDTQMI